jgi:enoyl-CoA hydratase
LAYDNLLFETAARVVTVTVNRPDKLNALNAATVAELHACFSALRDDAAVGAVVITGAGEKAFVAGADIAELAQMTPATAERVAARGQELMWKIENLGKPVIAAVNGYALGGGCELALACSFRYAAETARLGLPETGLGLIPGYGGTQRLPRLVGRGRASEMILTGAPVTAEQALALGLVERVLAPAELLPAVLEVAGQLAAKSAGTLRLALKAINEGANVGLDAACRLEAALFGVCGGSGDAHEGCAAFLEKRKPKFDNG